MKDLPQALFDDLCGKVQLLSLKKNQYLHRRGDEPDGYYGIVSGRMKMSSVAEDGKSSVLGVFKSGYWFGEISIVDGLPRTHDAIAMEPTDILFIPINDFKHTIFADPEALLVLASNLCGTLRRIMMFLEEATIFPIASRLANKLLAFGSQHTESESIEIQLTQQELADMLGVSRQSISSVLAGWVEENIIGLHYNSIQIVDLEKLTQIAGPATVPM